MKKVLLYILVGFVLIQLIPVDRTNKPIKKEENFVDVMNSPPEIKTMLKNACYDCHSYETVYPTYAYVAPISWSIKNHVNEGRKKLNFSKWGSYNQDIKSGIVENIQEVLENKTMPMPGYIVYHPEAKLTEQQNQKLIRYFKVTDSLRKY